MLAAAKSLSSLEELSLTTCIEYERLPFLVLLGESSKANEVEAKDVQVEIDESADDADSAREKLFVRCSVETDEEGKVQEIQQPDSKNIRNEDALVFPLNSIDLLLIPDSSEIHSNMRIRMVGKARAENVEWRFMVQMRILTLAKEQPYADAKSKKLWKIVDSDVFEFGNRVPPLSIHLNDCNIEKVKFVIRYVHQMFCELPRFDAGDVVLRFAGNEEIRTLSALLQMHSPTLAGALEHSIVREDGMMEIEIHDCSANSFRELLYQLYPTQRPIYADFRALSNAALAFRVEFVLKKLVTHIVNYDNLPFEKKIQEAYTLGLKEAVRQLVFNAVRSGHWDLVLKRGLDPLAVFSAKLYYEIICPAVAEAMCSSVARNKQLADSSSLYSFNDSSLAKSSFIAHLKIQDRSFYVNRALLKLHNDSMFGRGENGEYYVNMAVELKAELEICQMRMSDIMQPMLLLLYGYQKVIHADLIRPLIVFAVVHQMPHLKQILEEMLLMEPPITAHKMLDHLQWAKKYKLKNLERTTLFRMEGSYKETASELVRLPEFEKSLSEQFQQKILNRLGGKWARLSNDRINKSRPTSIRTRVISSTAGGPIVSVEEVQLQTMRDVDSDEVFDKKMDLNISST